MRGYVRYVDDFVVLGDSAEELVALRQRIDTFLHERLRLDLHPNKIVLQRSAQGVDFLGSVVFPHHRLTRQRGVRALRRRLAWFRWLIFQDGARASTRAPTGTWHRWLADHTALLAPGVPSAALLLRMLSTINSYYGMFVHAHTYTLRKHLYQRELGSLRGFFLPANKDYTHLTIRQVWLRG